MEFITIQCEQCGCDVVKSVGHVNRARKLGNKLFCGHACFGLSRRLNKTDQQKRAEKAEYDRKYREKNHDRLKAEKAEWFKRTYDPKAAAVYRKKRMPLHVAYCRRPEYRQKKKVYDELYHAKKNYGEFWESALLVKEIQSQYDDKEIRQINNLHNKSKKRKQQWRSNSKHPN